MCFTSSVRIWCRANGRKEEWCVYQAAYADGTLSPEVSIDIAKPQIMHDFQITRNYVVFMDGNIVMDGKARTNDEFLPCCALRCSNSVAQVKGGVSADLASWALKSVAPGTSTPAAATLLGRCCHSSM